MTCMAIAVLTSTLAFTQSQFVDFRLEGASPLPPVVVQPQEPPGSAEQTDLEAPLPLQPAARPRVIIARGFGADVPLDFAVRQVVPHDMHVEYAKTVDRQLRVSWKGGKPWRAVLNGLVAPEDSMSPMPRIPCGSPNNPAFRSRGFAAASRLMVAWSTKMPDLAQLSVSNWLLVHGRGDPGLNDNPIRPAEAKPEVEAALIRLGAGFDAALACDPAGLSAALREPPLRVASGP